MLELTNTAVQTVNANANVLFDSTAVMSGTAVRHRTGSGIATLTAPGRYRVSFSGNIAIPTGGTVGEISLAMTQEGEPLSGATMRVTPAAVNEYFNVSTEHLIDVYGRCCGCCQSVSIENTSGIPILVDNPNIVAEKVM